ncbi:MAG: DNA methyltransferase [Candidatus Aenigmarchaeota archaeon]|nr:DNA methyltransferase [Candidatus Aenigmarchaeota archaeon]
MKYPKGTTEHPLNKGKKQKILVSVWDFGAVHPQSERSYYACNDHPAKMRPPLARAILKLYGESPILDPMAGVGTTLVEAMLLGMNAVGVEYEKKFVKQANENLKYIQKNFRGKSLGKAVCIQGDARDLSCLNNSKVSSVLFSPPYFNAMKSRVSSVKEAMKKYQNSVEHAKRVDGRPISKALARSNMGYGTSKDNIGNISQFGSIIFSPPYFDALSLNKGGGSKASIQHEEMTQVLQMKRSGPFAVKKNLPTPYSSKQGNIGNQKDYGIFGSVILSPPYFCCVSDVVKSRYRYPVTKQGMSRRQEYSGNPSNIGNIAKFGSIVFSPPLGEANRGGGIAKRGYEGKHGKDEDLKNRCDRAISDNPNNISNFQYGRTYLSEMLKVYRECYRVLKPGKFMVVVVKDIQRNWKTIPLGADTIKLCQLAGFDCHDVIINKMYFPSFWILSLAKNSQIENLIGTQKFHALKNHEYVLVFRKP